MSPDKRKAFVLIDDRETGRYLEGCLRLWGWSATLVVPGPEAKAAATRERYSAFIAGVSTQRTDYLQLVEVVRQQEPAVRMVVISSLPSVQERAAALGLAVLAWGFLLADLRRALES